MINGKTVLVLTEYVDGKPMSRVIEGRESFLVDMPPKSLINYSLLFYGSSLQGAIKGSKMILGNTSMTPLKINGRQGLYWFPSISPQNPDCVWLSLIHIVDSEAFNDNSTKVIMAYGHTIIIEMKKARFLAKYQRTHYLKSVIEDRAKGRISFYLEPKKGLELRKGKGKLNYSIDLLEE